MVDSADEVEEKRERKCQKKLIILMERMKSLPTSNATNNNDRIVTLIFVWWTTFSIF